MKKCITFFLITAIILLNNAMFVSADSALDMLDTFDELDVGAISASDMGTYANAFDNGAYFRPRGAAISITEDGHKGNAVTFVEDGGTEESWIDIRNGKDNADFVPTDEAPIYLSFKMKIVNSVDNTERFHIKAGNSNGTYTLMLAQKSGNNYMWWHSSDTGRFNCLEGEWVDFQIKMTAGETEVKVSDMYGNVNTYTRTQKAAFIRITNADKIADASFALDEIRIVQGQEISTEPNVQTTDGIFQPTENVNRIPNFNFCYEPFMKVNSNDVVVSVADENGEPVDSDIYKVTSRFEIVNVKFTEILEKNAPYTITISGVKDMEGAEVSSYDFTFTTELTHKLTLAENGLNITSGDAPAIELTFDGTLGYPSTDVRVMSVIYDDGMMSYLDYRTDVIDADGKLVLSSYTLPDGKQLSDLTVLIFDVSPELIPVCEAIKCFE